MADRQASRPVASGTPEDALWLEFQETFGLVWSVRICERVNASALHEHWPVKLEMDGFHWKEDVTPEDRAATLPRIHHTLRWLMRRFVDGPWIDRYLQSPPIALAGPTTFPLPASGEGGRGEGEL
jgi:hypothetical protein